MILQKLIKTFFILIYESRYKKIISLLKKILLAISMVEIVLHLAQVFNDITH